MKLLTIGDVHAVIPELDDCSKLIDYIVGIAQNNKVDRVLFLGDLYHFHRVIHSEILYFWRTVFDRMKAANIDVASLIGNHDKSSEQESNPEIHALLAHKEQIQVIDKPWTDSGITYLPYYSDKQAFIDDAKANINKTSTLICHASFEGSKFNDGYFDPHGISPLFIRQENVIAGHVHLPFKFDKIQHIGAPRWRTLTDANSDRAIWLFEFDSNGHILNKTPFSTNDVCRQIKYVKDTELEPFNLNLFDPKHSWCVDIEGSSTYLEKRKKELQRPGLKIHCIKTDKVRSAVRESDGIKTAFKKFTYNFIPKYGTPNDKLFELAKERLELND